ncbi:hypothetical protein LTR70_008397 [Exophiala xenobiotica]|uniref:Uncharacterized protein n=1 Tax=Lithohypha guttulata TaxID=1690604 RepID=A0ABR0K2W1_9EURO|nr:hypothetical protein LTR24_008009 [Lithohypha guttulata]KAK5312138.1 hypothetical protein LTR70_008397 [Exophiala xenobiotica]
MKTTILAAVFSIAGVSADYVCPAMAGSKSDTALSYAYQIQQVLTSFYTSASLYASFFDTLPNASTTATNGMTLAENTATNFEGLAKQAKLASEALYLEINMTAGVSRPEMCAYNMPTPSNASAFAAEAFHLEATLCGAFIGLSDYFQTPTLNSLSARIAAEHGIHAAAIRGMMQPVGFLPNSTSLTPAFTPDFVLSSGTQVGQLGRYLNGCSVQGPQAPCGGTVHFGDLLSYLMGQNTTSTASQRYLVKEG